MGTTTTTAGDFGSDCSFSSNGMDLWLVNPSEASVSVDVSNGTDCCGYFKELLTESASIIFDCSTDGNCPADCPIKDEYTTKIVADDGECSGQKCDVSSPVDMGSVTVSHYGYPSHCCEFLEAKNKAEIMHKDPPP